ncbi:hypothetical protein LOZ57_003642 [Ophidiomyces ophidiicola]|uniref:uncharacterized protein n=1 Tax=Ophidiomyces ophidiicola TaxID=1387563 RepID=UPI0020C50480|nr:uncharacterized protein LOZ57_003642 [Ophidiomyces ophidiicola]KAI1946387.1 hypothetical protein LOZ57_003642 [Ophidiomyces ophidiicola]KAI2057936.1 hypothetical protein LOZ43_002870 [Ophidiomyces ophidiicola]
MESSVEILVHVSAPSGAEDDARYRELAAAYFDFEPRNRISIYPEEEDDDDDDGDGAFKNEEVVNRRVSEACDHPTLPNQYPGYENKIGEPIFYDALDGQTPHFNAVGAKNMAALVSTPGRPDDTDSFSTPPETVPDSQPSYSPTWGFGRNIDCEDEGTTTEISILVPLADTEEEGMETTPSKANLATFSSFGTVSEYVFESQSSFISTWDAEKNHSPRMGPVKTVRIDDLQSQSSQHFTFPSKRRRLSVVENTSDTVKNATIAFVDAGEVPSSNPVDSLSLPELRMEIHAPRPIPSDTTEFQTHITPTLQMLAETVGDRHPFKPAYQTRKLGPLERGYWALQIPIAVEDHEITVDGETQNSQPRSTAGTDIGASKQWTPSFFLRFWDYLSVFVGDQGRAGWGVWCFCDSAENQPVAELIRNLDVRIYAWGEIATHIYWLLYVASNKRVKGIPDVEWRDGSGETVIKMV